MSPRPLRRRCGGTTLLEVLITIVILAFGLLGLANLQTRVQQAEGETFQRTQALMLLSDMAARISANRNVANCYGLSAGSFLGTGASAPTPNCTTDVYGAAPSSLQSATVAMDLSEWNTALNGTGEQLGGNNTGAMIGARGCIAQVQPLVAVSPCAPAIFEIEVAWQGLSRTAAPGAQAQCAQGMYGDDAYRRVVSRRIQVPPLNCQ